MKVLLCYLLLVVSVLVAAQPTNWQALKTQIKARVDAAQNNPGQAMKEFKALMDQCEGGLGLRTRGMPDTGRFEVFLKKLAMAAADNAAKKPWIAGLDCTSLMTDAEFNAMLVVNRPADDVGMGRKLLHQHDLNSTGSDMFGMATQQRKLLQRNKKWTPPPPPPPPGPIPPPPPPPSPALPRPRCPYPCDWRSVNTKNYIPAVRNQFSCGSCGFFAAKANFEAMLMISRNIAAPPDTSVQYLINCAQSLTPGTIYKTSSGQFRCAYGSWPTESTNLLQSRGTVMEGTIPYTTTSGSSVGLPCNSLSNPLYTNLAAGPPQTIMDYARGLNVNNVNALRTAIVDGPLVSIVQVAWPSGYAGGVAYCSSAGEGSSFNHAVHLVGIKMIPDANGVQREVYVVQNSWGPGWGASGYIYITTELNADCGIAAFFAERANLRTGNLPL